MVQTATVDSKIGCEREMRLYSLCFIIHLLAANTNSEQIQIHGTKSLCDTKDAEQAIKELHDDLDDDDDGTISTTGYFINIEIGCFIYKYL